MRVNIDPARRDYFSASIDFLSGGAGNFADSGNQPVLHRDIAGKARLAGAIHDGATPG